MATRSHPWLPSALHGTGKHSAGTLPRRCRSPRTAPEDTPLWSLDTLLQLCSARPARPPTVKLSAPVVGRAGVLRQCHGQKTGLQQEQAPKPRCPGGPVASVCPALEL